MQIRFLFFFFISLLLTNSLQGAAKTKLTNKPTTVKQSSKYIMYYGLVIGPTTLNREVSLKTNGNGSNICKSSIAVCDTDSAIGTSDGSTYTFNEDTINYTKSELLIGMQNGYTGNFYEVNIYTGDDISELTGTVGYTFPEYTFSVAWFIPFFKGNIGLGYTGADSLNPTSLSATVGIGGYTIMKKFKLRYGFDYTKRQWSTIKHDYGNESWIDTETRGYIGVTYNY